MLLHDDEEVVVVGGVGGVGVGVHDDVEVMLLSMTEMEDERDYVTAIYAHSFIVNGMVYRAVNMYVIGYIHDERQNDVSPTYESNDRLAALLCSHSFENSISAPSVLPSDTATYGCDAPNLNLPVLRKM